MRRTRVLIPAAAQLRPYTQGEVSSLCGLYALLNAIQLALWPQQKLTHGQLKKLFVHGVEHLNNVGILTSVLRCGIEEHAWLKLCVTLIQHAHQLTGIKLRCKFFLRSVDQLTGRRALAAIKLQLRMGRPVLVTLLDGYDHVTVVVGYDHTKLILFDSSGFKWVAQTSVGLNHPSSTKRHQITRSTVVALWAGARYRQHGA